jgi:SAM-dependent methyltransferase
MTEWYREDLAYIHDVGHGDLVLKSIPSILDILVHSEIREGLVFDLGCGGGLWAREFTKVGYHVLGIDISGNDQDRAQEGARSRVSGRIAVRGRHPYVLRCHGGQRSSQLPVRHGERRPGTHQALLPAYTKRWFPAASLSSMSQGRGRSREGRDQGILRR